MLKIYGADLSSPANKVRFIANYLGLEYEYCQIKVRDGEHRKPEFLAINPVGKVPAIDDDGFTLFESNAICRYLIEKAGSDLWPKDNKERSVVDAWNDFLSIHVNSAMGKVAFNRLFAPFAKVPVDERSLEDGIMFLNRFLKVLDEQLSNNKYVAGDKLSLADFTFVSSLDPAEASQYDLSSFENIVRLRNELKSQEFYTKCHSDYADILKALTG